MLIKMHEICPKDDNGNPTYAVSLWSDWDDGMVMYVKSTVTAYYGYDEMGIGLYDPQTGKFHDALEDNGPYLQMLKFYNDLYRAGLVDPDSMTQTYDQMSAKVKSGGVLFSIFNYSGSLGFNTDAHLKAGKYMYCMKPDEAKPIVYGMNTQGGDRVTTIGAKTEYPDLCMEIINYFATPEGRMVYQYGPKGETWNYDKDGNTYFTELGKRLMPMVRQRWRSIRDHSRMEVSRLHSLHGLTMQRTLIQTVKHTTVITGNLMFRLLSIRFSRIGSIRQDVRTLTSTWKGWKLCSCTCNILLSKC